MKAILECAGGIVQSVISEKEITYIIWDWDDWEDSNERKVEMLRELAELGCDSPRAREFRDQAVEMLETGP